jgi:hypothetical protein
LRSGAVSEGAVVEVATLGMPAFHRIGAPGVAELEQSGPTTTTICWLDASLVAAVWPPSALHWPSSAMNLIGWPATSLFRSSKAISTARFWSRPKAVSGPERVQ